MQAYQVYWKQLVQVPNICLIFYSIMCLPAIPWNCLTWLISTESSTISESRCSWQKGYFHFCPREASRVQAFQNRRMLWETKDIIIKPVLGNCWTIRTVRVRHPPDSTSWVPKKMSRLAVEYVDCSKDKLLFTPFAAPHTNPKPGL